MNKFFVTLYDCLHRRKALLWGLLAVSTLLMAWYASKLGFSEDITSFLPDNKQGKKTAAVFNSLRIKDKIVILLTPQEAADPEAPDKLVEAADAIAEGLQSAIEEGLLRSVTAQLDAGIIDSATNLVYDHLPVFYTDCDFARLDSLTAPQSIQAAVRRTYTTLSSPAGIALKEILLQDPLGLGTHLMAGFQQFNTTAEYEIYEDHIFTPGLGTLLLFADPSGGSSATAANEKLVSRIEQELEAAEGQYDIRADYFGAVGVAVYNARQIKRDTMSTLTIALLIIIAVITFAFRNRWAVLLMVLPVLYGALFALAAFYFIQGSISTIAVGAGAAVMGIALSYSIHVLAHSNHIHDPRQVIQELAYPLTVGSFTTIGAFFGLIFTQSRLLHDFGLFSALTLTGTTLFCLVFLPHMLGHGGGQRPSRLLQRIERMNAYSYDSNKWLVGVLAAATLVCLFFYNDVRFDSDMTRLGYEPRRFKQTEQRLGELFGTAGKYVYVVSSSADTDEASTSYAAANALLDSLADAGMIREHVSAADFVIPTAEQQRRIARWEAFWTPEKQEEVCAAVRAAAVESGFRKKAFEPFCKLITHRFSTFDAASPDVERNPVLGDWINRNEELTLLVSRISLDETVKEKVYPLLEKQQNVSILDRAYFTSKMADIVSDDFNTILYISSILVFLALLLSYGRIELALLASLPMLVSWILILGMMALFGIEFNIVNIILSTFIFGLGDDFSIFIMDGLLNEYKDGRRLLGAHKTAIFFSAFTTVVGIGALVFAGHPALRSVSVISIVGMLAVVLVAYTIQPILFRLLVSGQTAKGGFPYTFLGILNTLYAFIYFLTGCILLQIYSGLLLLFPLGRRRRKICFHKALYRFTRLFLATMFTTRTQRLNPRGEDFSRPAVIVANHQSFIDILLLLSITPKLVMVTNSWVWNSPFFGRIVRFADFHHTADGYEALAESLRERIAEGYSVVVFPEGTRSDDCTIQRFHKGAFYLAELLKLDIVPILIYGAGMISSKRQPFYIKKGDLRSCILERITPDDARFGKGYRERAKLIRRYMNDEYENLKAVCSRSNNPYFRNTAIKNYLYKGPVLEWYMRVKLSLEHNYDAIDRLLPRDARIVDIGCGYGQMSFLMALYGDRRSVLGVDYDEEKIALANHCFLRSDRVRFEHADVTEYDFPEADAYVINDMLHYVCPEAQERILARCAAKLSGNGCIIVREGDSSSKKRHRLTEETERWSTRIIRFNKTCGALHFPTSEWMNSFAERYNLHFEIRDNNRYTSNTIYIFRKGGFL